MTQVPDLCSVPTMYRLLRAEGEGRERRAQLCHPPYQKPELLATAPNQVWSWDIAKLLGPAKWMYFYLYVIFDIFSRYVVGWMVAHAESAQLAQALIAATCAKQGIEPGTLTIYADRGSSMKSQPVALLLADLGVTKTHSRPHVSDDNPFSESQFKCSSTGRTSPSALARSRMRAPFAGPSLAGQHRAPPQWAGPPDARGRPRRAYRRGPRRPSAGPHSRVARSPGTLRAPTVGAGLATRRRLDQPAATGE